MTSRRSEIYLWPGLVLAGAFLSFSLAAQNGPAPQRSRVKDVATIEGIRDNQLVGYGLVVGLGERATARRPYFRHRR